MKLLVHKMRMLIFPAIIPVFLLIFISDSFAQDQVKKSAIVEHYKGKPFYMHTVREGETLFTIAKTYGVTEIDLKAENPELNRGVKLDMMLRIPVVDDSQLENNPQKTINPAGEQIVSSKDSIISYTVGRQETLYGISKKFNVEIDDILKVNPDMGILKSGTVIKIPLKSKKVELQKTVQPEVQKKPVNIVPVKKYTTIEVQKGETIYSLAKRYKISEKELRDLNPELADGLKAGQKLKVPALQFENEPVVKNEVKPETEKSEPQKDEAGKVDPKPVLNHDCVPLINKENVYQIAVLLPLYTDKLDEITENIDNQDKSAKDFNSFNYFQFYSGIKLALQTLEKQGFRANIQVMDADRENDSVLVTKALKKLDLQKTDLIIGPLFAAGFSTASKIAAENRVNIVNPLSRRESIIANNPFVFKVQPSDKNIAAQIHRSIQNEYPGANVIFVKNEGKDYAKLQEALIEEFSADKSITFLNINYKPELFGGVSKRLVQGKQNIVFFISKNKTMVGNFVTLLNGQAGDQDISLFGMQGWEDFELETDFLMNLDYHQFSYSYVDYENEEVKKFVDSFRTTYKTEPLVDNLAFLGYDIMMYFGTALMEYGKNFNDCLNNIQYEGLQYNFHFSAADAKTGMCNTDIPIISLDNYKWVRDK